MFGEFLVSSPSATTGPMSKPCVMCSDCKACYWSRDHHVLNCSANNSPRLPGRWMTASALSTSVKQSLSSSEHPKIVSKVFCKFVFRCRCVVPNKYSYSNRCLFFSLTLRTDIYRCGQQTLRFFKEPISTNCV